MTKIEKQIIGVVVLLVFAVAFSVFSISNSIDEAGGFKAKVIDIGKEIKDISREIAKD